MARLAVLLKLLADHDADTKAGVDNPGDTPRK
jgi:hypothetical protein